MKQPPRKKIGMTSVEAAALILSDGVTSDPNEAASMSTGQELNLDALQRAHLRRMMGFDFRVKITPNKVHISSKQKPYVTTHFKIKPGDADDRGNLVAEHTVDKLVEACLRLKLKYEDQVSKAVV